eukprot:Nk52_evm13s255 gene=Nk52_evmTU13s255
MSAIQVQEPSEEEDFADLTDLSASISPVCSPSGSRLEAPVDPYRQKMSRTRLQPSLYDCLCDKTAAMYLLQFMEAEDHEQVQGAGRGVGHLGREREGEGTVEGENNGKEEGIHKEEDYMLKAPMVQFWLDAERFRGSVMKLLGVGDLNHSINGGGSPKNMTSTPLRPSNLYRSPSSSTSPLLTAPSPSDWAAGSRSSPGSSRVSSTASSPSSSPPPIQQQLRADAKLLYNKYISPKLAHPLGAVSEDARIEVFRSIFGCQRVSESVFDRVQKEVFARMEAVEFKQFVCSPMYYKYLDVIVNGSGSGPAVAGHNRGVTLQDVIKSARGLFYFGEFMDLHSVNKPVGMPHVNFWLAAEAYQYPNSIITFGANPVEADGQDTATERREKAMKVYTQYISLQAQPQVKLPGTMRMDIENRICEEKGPARDCFAEAAQVVYDGLDKMYFTRFKRSNMFRTFQKEISGFAKREEILGEDVGIALLNGKYTGPAKSRSQSASAAFHSTEQNKRWSMLSSRSSTTAAGPGSSRESSSNSAVQCDETSTGSNKSNAGGDKNNENQALQTGVERKSIKAKLFGFRSPSTSQENLSGSIPASTSSPREGSGNEPVAAKRVSKRERLKMFAKNKLGIHLSPASAEEEDATAIANRIVGEIVEQTGSLPHPNALKSRHSTMPTLPLSGIHGHSEPNMDSLKLEDDEETRFAKTFSPNSRKDVKSTSGLASSNSRGLFPCGSMHSLTSPPPNTDPFSLNSNSLSTSDNTGDSFRPLSLQEDLASSILNNPHFLSSGTRSSTALSLFGSNEVLNTSRAQQNNATVRRAASSSHLVLSSGNKDSLERNAAPPS